MYSLCGVRETIFVQHLRSRGKKLYTTLKIGRRILPKARLYVMIDMRHCRTFEGKSINRMKSK